ncbi:uncharacterized protein [Spinacia oleracea]|uniref:Uncharacterized protein n=1 Tax=Spinacia oleracea TaxID=3562 RepID=A0ABM3RV93_SPIOL|nr:uncharacterized protein LOC130472467 [Spinacia oleracea]
MTIWDTFILEIGKQLLQKKDHIVVLLACGLQVKNFNGLFLSTGRFSRLYMTHKDATTINLVQWYANDNFAQRKSKSICNSTLSMHHTFLTSNAHRTTIKNFGTIRKVRILH